MKKDLRKAEEDDNKEEKADHTEKLVERNNRCGGKAKYLGVIICNDLI